jgi:folate-binding protein YgfZ
MVTNNIKDLAPGEGNYNFLLNAQGRIQADCTIYREPHEAEPTFLLESDRTQIDTIKALLDKFIIMDDVDLVHLEMTGIRLVGRASIRLVFEYFGWDPTSIPLSGIASEIHLAPFTGGKQMILYPPQNEDLDPSARSVELWSPDPNETDVSDTGLRTLYGAKRRHKNVLEALRILSVTPKFGQDIRNTDLPQETAQTHALNFNKGCYLGQEVVERIHSRGQVHRTFTAFTLTGALPTLPAPLTANDKPAGELTSAMQIGDTLYALGYLRREFATAPITYPGGTASPRASS